MMDGNENLLDNDLTRNFDLQNNTIFNQQMMWQMPPPGTEDFIQFNDIGLNNPMNGYQLTNTGAGLPNDHLFNMSGEN